MTEVNALEEPLMGIADALTDLGMEPGNWRGSQMLQGARAALLAADQHPETSPAARLAAYRSILTICFGDQVIAPTDADERDEYELVRRKLERRIADIAGDPNTLSVVSERAFAFNGVKESVRRKYRRHIQTLIRQTGDIPISHITPRMLREFRDNQFRTNSASSVQAIFTPIKTTLRYAIQEELIDINPMGSVQLHREKQSVQQRKWKPFTPNEAQRIFDAMDTIWGKRVRGMTEERRVAVRWVIKVMAFTSMRPKEVLDLEPERITDKWIKVEGSKTDGSDRVIPLHPELAEFPEFLRSGGFNTFKTQEKDLVQSVRHNFQQLIRKKMDPPITDPKKVLYSWRSTFSNALRRAGASPDLRRAILGHAEAGALRHYDDGPEFTQKRKWLEASDCRKEYAEPGQDDDLE
ncbi:phage integrase SAM-like domain-containing protein [Yoonia sp. GPGPB17]|uniref:tyrosine-type recombinase/integrase n=1 Tax=Yoonia sp. GPGPB17 TaxID=3026147 RepID=UPI0030C444ED